MTILGPSIFIFSSKNSLKENSRHLDKKREGPREGHKEGREKGRREKYRKKITEERKILTDVLCKIENRNRIDIPRVIKSLFMVWTLMK